MGQCSVHGIIWISWCSGLWFPTPAIIPYQPDESVRTCASDMNGESLLRLVQVDQTWESGSSLGQKPEVAIFGLLETSEGLQKGKKVAHCLLDSLKAPRCQAAIGMRSILQSWPLVPRGQDHQCNTILSFPPAAKKGSVLLRRGIGKF